MVLQYRSKRRGFHFYVQGQVWSAMQPARLPGHWSIVFICEVVCSIVFRSKNWGRSSSVRRLRWSWRKPRWRRLSRLLITSVCTMQFWKINLKVSFEYLWWQLQLATYVLEVVFDTVISSYDLTFDNSAYTAFSEALLKSREGSLPVRAGILFEMFPFCILFQVCLWKGLVFSLFILMFPNCHYRKIWQCHAWGWLSKLSFLRWSTRRSPPSSSLSSL